MRWGLLEKVIAVIWPAVLPGEENGEKGPGLGHVVLC